MALITNITSRDHVGNQPYREWRCEHYNECLNQAAKVNGSLSCDGCDSFVPREHLDVYDIEREARLLFAVFYPLTWIDGSQDR